MLLGQDRGRHQHGHLVAGVDRLERGPHRQFGLAEADVAAEQPVHRPRLLHVGLDRGDRRQLVGRFLVGKRGVELALPVRVGGKRDAGPRGAGGLQLEHVGGQIGDGLPRRLLLPHPHSAADVGQRAAGSSCCRRRISAPARSSRPARRFSCRRGTRAPGALRPGRFFSSSLQPAIAADAVREVHDVVAFAQLEKAVDHAAQPAARRAGSGRRDETARCR